MVVIALASHQCGLGFDFGLKAIHGLSLLLVLYSARSGSSGFLSAQKPTSLNSNLIWMQALH